MVFRLFVLLQFCHGIFSEAYSQVWEELGSQTEEQATGVWSMGRFITGCETLQLSACSPWLSICIQTTPSPSSFMQLLQHLYKLSPSKFIIEFQTGKYSSLRFALYLCVSWPSTNKSLMGNHCPWCLMCILDLSYEIQDKSQALIVYTMGDTLNTSHWI